MVILRCPTMTDYRMPQTELIVFFKALNFYIFPISFYQKLGHLDFSLSQVAYLNGFHALCTLEVGFFF